jgi:hypothetical protein
VVQWDQESEFGGVEYGKRMERFEWTTGDERIAVQKRTNLYMHVHVDTHTHTRSKQKQKQKTKGELGEVSLVYLPDQGLE